MNLSRFISVVLLAVAIVAGTASDFPRTNPPLELGGYRVLEGDFHVHNFPFNWAALAPWDLVLEARRQHLDVIAITAHNRVWPSKVGVWFSALAGGPTVLTGEEVVSPHYHLLGIGIDQTVDWRQNAAGAIDDIHRQGGVAIAAHPGLLFWPGYDDAAVSRLDGSEVLHPVIYAAPRTYGPFQQFYRRVHAAAIGDSDYHGLWSMGMCRTYVFAKDDSPAAILDAIRARRTVVYDRDNRAYGDPQLIALSGQDSRFTEMRRVADNPDQSWMVCVSGWCGVLGLLTLFLSF